MMTWPSSAPSRRTSRASGSRAPAVPIPPGSARSGRSCGRSGALTCPATGRAAPATQRGQRPQPFDGRNLSYPCIVMVDDAPSRPRPVESGPTSASHRPSASARSGQRRTARPASLPARGRAARDDRPTWDELLETVVDGTRDALHADVSSLYLLDRDGAYLTLARRTAWTASRSAGRASRSAKA